MTPLVPAQANFVSEFLAETVGLDTAYTDPIGAAVLFVVAFAVVYVVGRAVLFPLVERIWDRRAIDSKARRPLNRVVTLLLVFAAVTVAFGAAGFGNFLLGLTTIAAAATIAVGFAMQDVLKNFVAGVFIYTDKPFTIGDWIEWEDHAGIVEDISLRVSRVRTFDNELLTVPNSELTDNVVKNPVAKETLRMKVTFGIGYDDDIQQATDIILEEADAHPDILEDPAPSVRLTELGDSDVALQSRVWIADPSRADFVKTRGEYVTSVKERFDAAGIDIPYPHRTLTGGIDIGNGAAAIEPEAEAETD